MKWKIWAFYQNMKGKIPFHVNYFLFDLLSPFFGLFRQKSPANKLASFHRALKLLKSAGTDFEKKIIFELGTGLNIDHAILFWIFGAKHIYCTDLNPYLKRESLLNSINWFKNNSPFILNSLPQISEDLARIVRLKGIYELDFHNMSFGDILRFFNISYLSPCDARDTRLEDKTIDIYFSYNVFEHIPLESLKKIVFESRKILKDKGCFFHQIDFSDHFSHLDKHIFSINFLRYSEKHWLHYCNNPYAYHNRLRYNDYLKLLTDNFANLLLVEKQIDSSSLEAIKAGFPLAPPFKSLPPSDVAIKNSTFIGRFEAPAQSAAFPDCPSSRLIL